MSESSKTVLEVLQSTTAYFSKHGVESPRLNSEHLVAHVLGKKRLDLYLEFDRPLFEFNLAPLREMVRERAQGKPLQHLLGTVEFYGRVFACDQRALIPRPETEQLVEFILELFPERINRKKAGITGKAEQDASFAASLKEPEHLKEGPSPALPPLRILDVGTGSGVIALTLAAELQMAEVEAVDLSEDALALARENAAKLPSVNRIKFAHSDLLGAVTGSYDLIVANLPYIDSEAIPGLCREVRCDPQLALDGGAGGLEIISRLVSSAKDHLRAGGLLALEIGLAQSESLITTLERQNYQDIQCKSDYQGSPRFLFAKYG